MLRKTLFVGVALLGTMLIASGQEKQGKGKGKGKGVRDMTQTTMESKPGLFFISGAGGHSLVRVTNDGLIVMDGKLPGNYDPFMEQVKKISDQPIKFLITTHHHEDHTGNNAKFLAAGVQIIAQDNMKKALEIYNPPGGKVAQPTITYAKDYVIRLGGVEVDLHHYGPAHTGDDTVVYFPDLKVIALSDEIGGGAPGADYAGGGSLLNWGHALGEALKLDWDTCVPGGGKLLTRADVQEYKNKVDTLVSRAKELVAKGTPKDQLMDQLKTDDLGWKLNLNGERLDKFYDELSQSK